LYLESKHIYESVYRVAQKVNRYTELSIILILILLKLANKARFESNSFIKEVQDYYAYSCATYSKRDLIYDIVSYCSESDKLV